MCSTVRQVQEPTFGSVTLAEIGPKGLSGKTTKYQIGYEVDYL